MEAVSDLWLLIKYIFLGLFQGVTEPIPISSSGHLVLLKNIFGIAPDGLLFEVFVNFGSLIAVLLVYRKDIIRLVKNGWSYAIHKNEESKSEYNFIVFLILGTIPAAVLGILLEDWIGTTFNQPYMIGITLIITGIALWIIRNLRGNKGEGNLTWKDALIVGFAQAVALVPGISRSGATIVAAMLLGMKQDTALRFSFLLYIPVSLGTMVLSIGDIVGLEDRSLMIPWLLAIMASIIATYFSLKWFMNIMAQGNLKYFAFYCFIVGAIAIIILS
ncbi:undecaprenyl-diphosphate phosphatase [Thalassobacillus hwangdonensis]|uniref:Undecaprenyl-diphosphatase n=1 Tax=Thalassobacillus hwangdonensis TaxID=546108 RepID=A0ABW3KZU4_9BACI